MLVRNAYTHDSRVEREARTLVGAGYRLTVVAEARPGLPPRETRDGASVLRVARRGPRLPGLRFLAYRLLLQRAVERTRPHVLHAHDADALQSVGPAARRLRIPFVYDSHELWLARSRRGRSRLYDRLAWLYWWWIERRYVPRAAAVIVANAPVAPELERRYGVRAGPVPNYPEEVQDVERAELRGLSGGERIPADAPVILYIGGIMRDRGIEQVLRALPRLPAAQLVCLGPAGELAGSLVREAQQLGVADRLHLLAPVPPDRVVAHAASATVGVSMIQPFPLSYRLAVPNKLFQYMAAGVPVVASDFPHIRDIVEGSHAGVVADPTDPAAIADALRRYLTDADAARQAGENGRRAVRERYSWARSAEALLEVYRQLEVGG